MTIVRRAALLALLVGGPEVAHGQELTPTYRRVFEGDSWISRFTESSRGLVAYVSQRDDSIYVYSPATRRSQAVGVEGFEMTWAPAGDRLAFVRGNGTRWRWQVFSVPVDPATGRAAGPAQRVSTEYGWAPRYSPDGASLVYMTRLVERDSAWGIVVVPASGGRERVLVASDVTVGSPVWSPDGRWVYYTRGTPATAVEVHRVPAAGGPSVRVAPGHTGLGLSADGRWLATGEGTGTSTTITVTDTAGRRVGRAKLRPELQPQAWGATGARLLAVERLVPQSVHAITVADGSIRSLTGDWGTERRPHLSPDGRTVAFLQLVDDRVQIAIIPVSGGARRTIPTRAEPFERVRWSPDGRRLAFIGSDAEGRPLVVVDVAAGTERRLAEMHPSVERFFWRADGGAIVYPAQRDRDHNEVRETTLDGATRTLVAWPSQQRNLRHQLLGPDWLARSRNDSLTLVPLRGGAERRMELDTVPARLTSVVGLSPDGRTVAVWIERQGAGGWEGITRLLPIDGGRGRDVRTTFDQCGVNELIWHPDGRHLVVGGAGTCPEEEFRIHLVPLDGGPIRDLTARSPGRDFNAINLSPDGSTIIVDVEKEWRTGLVEIDLAPSLGRVGGR